MPVAALAMILVAALLHAAWNIAAKRAGGSPHFVLACALLIAGLWAPLGLWAAWDEVPRWGLAEWALVVASGMVNLAYLHVLLRGYRESDLTVVYPVARGTGPLITSTVAVLVLGEPAGGATVLGVLAVCGGIFLVAGGPTPWRVSAHDAATRQRLRAGVAWGAATGALIAAYSVIDGVAVQRFAIPPLLVVWLGNTVRVPVQLAASWRQRHEFARAWPSLWRPALLTAVISPVAYGLALLALRLAPLSHVAPAREVSMLFAALLGGRLLGESDRGWRVGGAALMATGVALLATAGGHAGPVAAPAPVPVPLGGARS